MSLIFIKETHTYILDGAPIPSVTQILQPINNIVYEDIDPVILNRAAERGTAVHEATECVDRANTPELPKKWSGYIDAYNLFLAEHEVKWLSTEEILSSKKHGFAGTVDRIGLIDGYLTLLDLKTSYKIHDELVIPQLSGYQILADNNKIMRFAILRLQNGGEYELKYYKTNKRLFLSLLTIYKFLEKMEVN